MGVLVACWAILQGNDKPTKVPSVQNRFIVIRITTLIYKKILKSMKNRTSTQIVQNFCFNQNSICCRRLIKQFNKFCFSYHQLHTIRHPSHSHCIFHYHITYNTKNDKEICKKRFAFVPRDYPFSTIILLTQEIDSIHSFSLFNEETTITIILELRIEW